MDVGVGGEVGVAVGAGRGVLVGWTGLNGVGVALASGGTVTSGCAAAAGPKKKALTPHPQARPLRIKITKLRQPRTILFRVDCR
jgi:hypothetical protein